MNTTIELHGSEAFFPQNDCEVFRIIKGEVSVFIAPWDEKTAKASVPLFLCDVAKGGIIPTLVYIDHNYRSWRFCIRAKGSAGMTVRREEDSSGAWAEFFRVSGIEYVAAEGAEQSVVNYYIDRELNDEIKDIREDKLEEEINISSFGIIKKLFVSEKEGNKYSPELNTDDATYRTLAYACKAGKIRIESLRRLRERCGSDITIENIAKYSGFICRSVVLDREWYKSDCGIIISSIEGEQVACIPGKSGKYEIYHSSRRKIQPLDRKEAEKVDPKAYSICRVLPDKVLSFGDLVSFEKNDIHASDVWLLILLGLAASLIGILIPTLNQKIYDDYIPLGNISQMVQFCCLIASFMIGNLLFGIVKNLTENRVTGRIGFNLQNAFYFRLFQLPSAFFRKYDSADLAKRVLIVSSTASSFVKFFAVTLLSFVFSLIYLFKMFKYSKKLSWITLGIMALYLVIMYFIEKRTLKYEEKINEYDGDANACLFQLLNGIEKLRMAGAEQRAEYQYLVPMTRREEQKLRKDRTVAFTSSVGTVISTIFTMIMYYIIVKKKQDLSMGNFMAFTTAFGSFSAATFEVLSETLSLERLKSLYRRFKPIMECNVENSGTSEQIQSLDGSISIEHVTFSYGKGLPDVLENLSLDIKKNEYVAIVGTSGCGKSTLMKLLLGFETPTSGQILYDGIDMQNLDKRSLRKNIGVVLQGGSLIAGSIFDNITITKPDATTAEVNEVIKAVGLKEDIDAMPMGIQTMLSENSGTISGGQQQRILIARAIINHPSILFFDEATSALDNITQKTVSDSLSKMNVTRLVIAHRLSTVKDCDRIVVMDKGTVAEMGTYAELMEKRGMFYELAKRQTDESEESKMVRELKPSRRIEDDGTVVLFNESGDIFTMNSDFHDNSVSVRLTGDLLTATAPEISAELMAFAAHKMNIEVDMKGVRSISGAVCREVFVKVYKQMGENVYIRLINVPQPIIQTLRKYNLDQIITVSR